MKKILAFAGSNHTKSINYQLLEYVASTVDELEVSVLDIRIWDIPMYSLDLEVRSTPEKINELIELIQEYDGFIIASPEHNGGTPAFLKNIIDWVSRKTKKVFDGKPVLLLSTSPGGGGGAKHLTYLSRALGYLGAVTVASFSLPSFHSNFKDGMMTTADQAKLLKEEVSSLKSALTKQVGIH